MATNDDKINIWIRLGDVKQPIPLSVNRDEEAEYRNAENLVNTLWNKWMARFNDTSSSHEVMARVAFQFARLYAQAYNSNVALNEFLSSFEQELDEVVLKV